MIIDPEKARGARSIVDACPYGAISWNEELQLPQHWNFDAHLLDAGWNQTRGSQACPTGALGVRKLDDATLEALRRDEGWAPLRPELESRPRVYFKNLHRVNSIFIAGTVLRKTSEFEDVLAGASVRLLNGSDIVVANKVTDEFGDFRLDGVDAALATACSLNIVGPVGTDLRSVSVQVSVTESAYIGAITLQALAKDPL